MEIDDKMDVDFILKIITVIIIFYDVAFFK